MVDQGAQLGRKISAVCEIEKEASKGRAVLLQKRHQFPSIDVGSESLLHAERQTTAGAGGPYHDPHVIRRDPGINRDVEFAAIFLKFPAIRRHLWSRSPANAAVLRKLGRMRRRPKTLDVGRGGHDQLALIV